MNLEEALKLFGLSDDYTKEELISKYNELLSNYKDKVNEIKQAYQILKENLINKELPSDIDLSFVNFLYNKVLERQNMLNYDLQKLDVNIDFEQFQNRYIKKNMAEIINILATYKNVYNHMRFTTKIYDKKDYQYLQAIEQALQAYKTMQKKITNLLYNDFIKGINIDTLSLDEKIKASQEASLNAPSLFESLNIFVEMTNELSQTKTEENIATFKHYPSYQPKNIKESSKVAKLNALQRLYIHICDKKVLTTQIKILENISDDVEFEKKYDELINFLDKSSKIKQREVAIDIFNSYKNDTLSTNSNNIRKSITEKIIAGELPFSTFLLIQDSHKIPQGYNVLKYKTLSDQDQLCFMASNIDDYNLSPIVKPQILANGTVIIDGKVMPFNEFADNYVNLRDYLYHSVARQAVYKPIKYNDIDYPVVNKYRNMFLVEKNNAYYILETPKEFKADIETITPLEKSEHWIDDLLEKINTSLETNLGVRK